MRAWRGSAGRTAPADGRAVNALERASGGPVVVSAAVRKTFAF